MAGAGVRTTVVMEHINGRGFAVTHPQGLVGFTAGVLAAKRGAVGTHVAQVTRYCFSSMVLITVSDAILAGRQDGSKQEHLFQNLKPNIFSNTLVSKSFGLKTLLFRAKNLNGKE